jgi:four helix bundle protein
MNISQNSNLKSQIHNSNLKSTDVKVRAYKFSLEIIRFVNELPNKRAFWSIGDQLLRSATSIGANMMEAQASSSKREFIKFYQIALKSSNETKYWLYLLRDSYGILKSKRDELIKEVIEIDNMLGSGILTMKGKRKF